MLAFAVLGHAHAGVLVIGHANLAKLDEATLQKVYTGKVFDVGGINVVAINASSNNPVRGRFLQSFLNQDEEKYTAYWTVRRYIGKGTPPKEFSSSAEIIQFVQNTPGAIGYIDEADAKPGLHILLKK
ncbi:MAG: hypothetical protein HYZ45_07995 [Burkholderiales bacterium]|nr:hypothetical protein [Burkholderiales bacterium]